MIPSNNPFRKLGKFESYVAAFMAEDDKKPLIKWFDKFEKVLKKLGTDYKKSSINPTDALEFYYDGKSPDEAAKSLAESVELDEADKSDITMMIVSALDKIGVGYEISGQVVKVNPKNVIAAKKALSKKFNKLGGLEKAGMSVVKDNKVSFAAESEEQVDEYIKKDGARKRCAGGDGRRTDVEVTELSREEPKVFWDFKSERDAKQFAKDVENASVGLANSGVEKHKGKYRVVITGMTKDTHKKAIGKYAHKNKGEFSHATSEVTPKGYGPYDESYTEDEKKLLDFINKNW